MATDVAGAFPGGLWAVRGTTLFISADGGATFRQGTLPAPAPLSVYVFDATHAWAVYPVGATLTPVTGSPSDVMQLFVYRTTDGGTTWDNTKLTENVADTRQTMAFRDASYGYILNWALRQSGGVSTLLETSDGGATWQVAGSGAWLGGEFGAGPDGTLWAGSEPTAGPEPRPLLDVSRDGGRTWHDAGLPGLVGAAGAPYSLLGPPAFFGADGVAAVLDESGSAQVLRVYTSRDAGASWTQAASVSRSDVASFAIPFTFAAAGPARWLIGGLDGASLHVTSDAGRTWRDVPTQGLPAGATGLIFADGSHGAAEVAPDNALYVTADGGRTWTPAPTAPAPSPTPTSGDWTGLRWSAPGVLPTGDGRYALLDDVSAWGGGYVAVGALQYDDGRDAPAAWWSADGERWSLAYTGAKEPAASMRWLLPLADRIVALGTAGTPACSTPGAGQTCQALPVAVWTSTDGQQWTQGPSVPVLAGATIAAIAAGHGRIVAVGDAGFDHPGIWTSTNGMAWTREALPAATFAKAHVGQIVSFGGGFVVAGGVGGTESQAGGVVPNVTSPPAIWYSPDGLTWRRAAMTDASQAGQIETLAAGADGLLAEGPTPTGITAAVWTSTDGRAWSRLSDPSVLPGAVDASDGRRMVAQVYETGDQVSFSVSTEGVNWHALTDLGAAALEPRWPGAAGPTISGLRVTPDRLIVLGQDSSNGSSLIWVVPAVTAP